MTTSDLIVMVPWVVFAAVLAVIYIRLRVSRRRCNDRQEAQWPETKTHTRR